MNLSQSFLDELNEQQKQAAAFAGKRLMVLAGAGSGKTKTLVARLAYFCSMGIDPSTLVAITFTNKAAKEMKERLLQCVPEASQALVGTFHHVSNKLLRRYGSALNLNPNFQIITPLDQKRIIKEAIKTLKITLDNDVTESFILKALSYRHQSQDEAFWQHPTHRVARVISFYDEFCQKENSLDFDSMIIRARELFQTPFVKENFIENLNHVCVDEFQDTNYQQILWLESLLGLKTGLTLVGDDDQSIYRFRGSDVTIMQTAHNRFEGLELIKLERNYRSTSTIVRAANNIISKNKIRLGKNLWTEKKSDHKISVQEVEDENSEARKVAEKIHLLLNKKVPLSDIAILYRSNRQSRVFEGMARKFMWEYRLSGGQGFFDREEIKDVLSYLQLIVHKNSTLALSRVINKPARRIGPKSLEKIADVAQQHDLRIWDALIASQFLFKGKTQESIAQFIMTIDSHRKSLAASSLADLTSSLIVQIDLLSSYDKATRDQREDNIHEFINALIDYENNACPTTSRFELLEAFLTDVALMANAQDDNEHVPKLTLSTVHASKGLEWPYVFIVGMQDDSFPSPHSRVPEELAEERRLFYVALTRAREQCFLSYARVRYTGYEKKRVYPSRYLNDLDSDLIEFQREVIDFSQRRF